jgi:hypothetical protein
VNGLQIRQAGLNLKMRLQVDYGARVLGSGRKHEPATFAFLEGARLVIARPKIVIQCHFSIFGKISKND